MTKETKTSMTLNSLSSVGTSKNRKRELEEGLVLALEKLPGEVIKVKSQGQAAILDKGLRVDKCHFR